MRQKDSPMRRLAGYAIAAFVGAIAVSSAFAADPIKIGFSMAQSGPLAGSGKSALLAMKIWAEDQNAKGRSAWAAGGARLL
jgi:branched-chain amino acid transport system substrate-binding protein